MKNTIDYQSFFTKLLEAQDTKPSNSTIKNYRADLGHFVTWFEKKYKTPFSPEKINAETISAFKTTSRLSDSSQKRHIAALKKFYSLLSDRNYSYTPFKQPEKKDALEIGQIHNFLTTQGIGSVTLKNYLSDIRSYLLWSKTVTNNPSPEIRLSPQLLSEYQERLKQQGVPQSSINRKVASLKKLQDFARVRGLVTGPIYQQVPTIASAEPGTLSVDDVMKLSSPVESYSNVPPIRLFQRLTKPYFELEEKVATNIAISLKKGSKQPNSQAKMSSSSFIAHPETVTKEDQNRQMYAPISAPKTNLLRLKVLYHAQYTRPKWYKRYHSFTASHYLHLGILILSTVVIGFVLYKNTIGGIWGQEQAYAAPAPPPKILAFQGTLSNEKGIPITTPTSVTFNMYAQESQTDTNSLWNETQEVTPDKSGSFTVYLGTTTPLDTQIFAQNNQLFLGISVGGAPELAPRQRLASVAYASNTEYLQGMPPISQSTTTANTILHLNSQGNLVIPNGASTKFHATGGNFTLSGQATILTTNEASNGNIVLTPNGTGKIDIQGSITNSSQNGALWPGSVTISDETVVSATSSGIAAFTVTQGGTGNIFTASSSGVTRFFVDSQGHVGINTNQATEALQINGSISLENSGGRIYGENLSLQSSGTTPLLIQPSSLSTNNVGIGSTSPQAFVHVQGGSGTTPLMILNYTGSGQNILTAQTSGSTVFAINQSGNVGIGTSQTSSALNLASSTSNLGGITFGSDTNLYRSGTSELTTDDSFTVGTDLTVLGSTTFNNITYSWPASDGTNGQVLTTDSAGNLTWTDDGDTNWQQLGGAVTTLNLTDDIYIGGNSLASALIRLAGNNGDDTWFNTGGNLGIGTTTPQATLDVDGSVQLNLTDTATTNGVCHSGAASDTTAQDRNLVACSSAPADIAEWYAADSSLESGYIAELTNNTLEYDSEGGDPGTGQIKSLGKQKIATLRRATDVNNTLGIVSTGPYQTIGSDIKKGLQNNPEYKAVPVALAGRVLLKIAHNSASIKPGDPITLATTAGKGQKATSEGFIVARALEPWDKDKDQILVYVQPTWFQPVDVEDNISINRQTNGSFDITSSGTQINRLITASKVISAQVEAGALKATQATITGTLKASEIIALRIKAGSIEAQNISVDTLNLTTDSFTIAGKSLQDYIDDRIQAQNNSYTEQGEVKTNKISKLSDNELKIENNASVSGNLKAQNISTEGHMSANSSSISGTLTVNKLVANEIVGLEEKIASVSSATAQTSSSNTALNSLSPDSNGLIELPSHTTPFAIFEEGLTSFGPATFNQLTAVNNLEVGSGSTVLKLTETSLNTLTTLEIQPLAQAGVSFFGGQITLDTQGNMVVNGSALIKGTLAARDAIFEGKIVSTEIQTGTLSPLPENDLAIRLGQKSDNSSQKFKIQNSEGRDVLTIDNKGNVEASGSGTFSKLNFWNPDEAYAEVSDTQVTTSGSAGKAMVKAGRKEMTVTNPNVTEKSLIYITPSGETEGKVISLTRQNPEDKNTNETEGSFTVGIPTTSTSNIEFNWLIVN